MKMVLNAPFREVVIEHSMSTDLGGRPLEGAKRYKLHLPPNIPVVNFWSVIVYDMQTQLMIRTDQPWPSVYSTCKKLVSNRDGSIDIWFGSEIMDSIAGNSVKTIPGKGWYLLVRLYDPMQADADKSWRPGEIEEVK